MTKKRIVSIAAMVIGVLMIASGLLTPKIMMAMAQKDQPIAIIGAGEESAASIGIIGGADGPTYMYVHQTVFGGALPAVVALGALALISGVIVWIVDTVQRKRA